MSFETVVTISAITEFIVISAISLTLNQRLFAWRLGQFGLWPKEAGGAESCACGTEPQ